MFCLVSPNFCYIPSMHLFDSTVKLDNVEFTSTFMPGNSLCGHKAMISLEEPSKSGRNVGCEREKKSFCWNTNIFCETNWSNYSSGTVIVRGCGNKYQPRFSLTITILFFSKLAQAWSLLKPLLFPYQKTVIGATLLCHILWQGHHKSLPEFHVTAPGIPFCTSKGGQWQHNPGGRWCWI